MPPRRGDRFRISLAGFLLAVVCSICGSSHAGAADPAPPDHSYDRSEGGEWAVAGASRHDGYRGAAYVYRRDGRRWVLDATLAPPERGAFARFGGSVAMEGNTLVIGAPWDDGWKGAAYVYERVAGSWSLISRLAPDAAVGDRFGSRVTLSAGVASLAANGGAVARFQRSPGGWTEVARGAPGAGTLASGRTVDANLLETVAAQEARGGISSVVASVALDPPAVVRATDGVYEDRTEIRWTSVSAGPLLYKIYRRPASQPPSADVLIRVASQDDSLFADVTGTPGIEYTYCVTVVDMANVEGAATCDNGRRIIFPPTNFTASDATFEGYVRLQWSDRSGVEAGYRILRNGGLLRETAPNLEVAVDDTAVPGTVYSYELIAFDAAANATTPLADNGSSAFIAAPLQVSATDGQHTDRVVITWLDATAKEKNYRVYRAAGGAPLLLATLPPDTTSFEDLTAVNGTPYEYCVAAVDSSDLESARTCDAGGIGVLPAPANVLATDGTFDDKVRVNWQDESDTEDGFLVYRMPAGTADSTLVGTVGADVTAFDDKGGEPGTAYTYCVVSSSNRGGRSTPVCDDGLRAIVLAPTTVAATDGAFEDKVDITWASTSTSVVLFKIYRGGTFIRSVGGGRRTYTDDGGPAGVTTAYSVTALSALGVESPAATDSGFRRIHAPVSVKASDDEFEDHVAVSWTDRSEIEAGFFVDRRRTGTADPPERIATRLANSTTYLDRTGAPGQTYDYLVTAFQAYGPGRADTTVSEAGTTSGSRALAAPTFVEASDGASESQVELTWVDNSRYEEAYHVWRRNTATNDSSRVAVLPPNSNHWVDTNPVFAVVYEYSVFAVDSLGGALLGASPRGADLGNTQILPPTGVSASDLYEDRVAVAWIDQSTLETSYRITRDDVEIGTAPINATSFVDNSAVTGVQYTYCVQSVSGVNASQAVCDEGQRAASTLDVSSISFTDLPGVVYNLGFDGFGISLDGEGDWLIVGAPGRQYWPGAGPVYPGRGAVVALHQEGFGGILSGGYSPFTGSGGSMDLGADNTTAGNFGMDVAISGDWVFATYTVGADDRVAILRQNYPSPWTVEQNFPLTTSGTAYRGVRVDVSGDNAVIGHPIQGARFLQKDGSDFWSNPTSFGGGVRAVAMSGNTTLTGGSGSVGVFTLNGTWSNTQTLLPPSPDPGFGFSVDVQGDRAVVGSHVAGVEGVAYVYERDGGGVWQPTAMLQPDRTGTSFGFSVSVRGTTILVGSEAVYVFELTNGAWIRREVLGGPSGCFRCVQSPGDRGSSVRVINGLIAAGDPTGSNDNNQNYIESRVYPFVAPVESPGQVSATDDTYRDKVQITWQDLSTTEAGFRVYRDGELIATVDPNTRIYTDFDAAPGRTYEYCVAAFVDSSARPPGAIAVESVRACDFGRRPPDGNITGRVSTLTGAGVSGVNVCLDPSPNRAVLFDGSGGSMAVSDGAVFGAEFTVEFWYRGHAVGSTSTLLSYSTPSTADAFAVVDPSNLRVLVNGTLAITSVAVNDDTWHHVAIDWKSAPSGLLHIYRDGQLVHTGFQAAGQSLGADGSLRFGAGLSGAMDDIRVWDHVRAPAEIQQSLSEFLTGTEAGLSAYWPLNNSQGIGVEELKGNRYGRLSAGAHWIGDAPPMNACALSDVQGNYVLPDLRYGTSTTFKVTPAQAGHQYEPAFKTITLSTGSPVQNEVAFNDITSYTVSGVVRYQGESCVAENVPIYVDDVLRGTTDGSGRFAVPVSPGTHRLEPRISGHTFLPAAITLSNVASDLADQSFTETTVRHLAGTVGGGCDIPIGTVTIRIDSENGCVSRTFDASQGYEEELPPLKYFVRAIDVVGAPGGVDPAQVLRFFDNVGAREVDLSAADQTLDFKYRAPLKVEIEGLPPVGCMPVPVVAQTERHPLTIRVVEDYGTRTCPVDTGTVTVFDEIIDQEQSPVTLVVRNGQAYVSTDNGLQKYVTAGNTPNIFAGRVDSQGNDRSYQKPISVVAEVEGQESVTKTEWVIVTGHRPRAATFTALSEGIPLMILRDPPGDRSFSSVAKDTSICTKISKLVRVSNVTGYEQKTKVGVDFLLGFILMTKVRGQLWISGGFEIGIEGNTNDELEICAKTTEEFRTSSENAFIGRDGDVYVGLAINLLFAKTDVVKVVGCNVVTSEEVTIGADDVKTVYAFTDWHIRNAIIPQLEDLASLEPARSFELNSARQNWESHLALNDSLKAAAPDGENRSFSAGADYTYSSTVEENASYEWSVAVSTNADFALGFGFDVSATGAEGGYHTRMEISTTRGGARTVSTSRTTSYTLSDDDIADFFSVHVKQDPVYGTPVFDLVGGTSSCPWEPWRDSTGVSRTQPRDAPSLAVEPPVQLDVDPDGRAEFVLTMTNNSPAEESREYYLMPVQAANQGGASIFVGGDTFIQLPFFLNYGEPKSVSLTVIRGPVDYRYENLQLVLIPVCEFDYWRNTGVAQIADTVTFTVQYKAPCSDIAMLRPNPGWSVTADSDSLELILDQFELEIGESTSLYSVGAEYQRVGTDTWSPIGQVLRSNLPLDGNQNPRSVRLSWLVTSVPDGAYTVRAFTRCGDAGGPKNYSGSATGVIDRSAPQVFGSPQPADGVLSFGEDISITFDEDIDCTSANALSVQLEVTPEGTPLDAPVTCNRRTLVIAPTTDLAAYEGRVLRATVTGILDLSGNPSATRTWTFTVRQGEFTWAQTDVSQDVGYGAGGRVAVNLVNGLNQPVQVTLGTLPGWLTAEGAATEIPARSMAEVAFQVDPNTALGSYDATLVATATTDPPTTPRTATLDVHVNVVRMPPTWAVDPADYEHSMTVRAKVYVDADSLISPDDVLAAFVGNQVRGVAHPQLVSDGWRYFLTVYGKPPAYERVRFRVWDSRTSKTWVATDKTLRFAPDSILGAHGNPFEIRTRQPSPAIEQVIAINAGWTWFSVNRRPAARDDRTVAAVLSNLIPTPGDLVKAQDGAIAMFDATAGWIGTLDTLGVTKSYRLKVAEAGEIRYESVRVLPSAYPIPVKKGWNWIGYTPDDSRALSSALGGYLSVAGGDVLRSQTAFAQYGQSSWAGNLAEMSPGLGYVLYRSNVLDDQFPYSDTGPSGPLVATGAGIAPEAQDGSHPADPAELAALPGWAVDEHAYQYDMVVTAQIAGLPLGSNHQVAAVVDGEIRGIARPVHVPALGRTLVFLMVRGNRTQGETIHFQALDRASGNVFEVEGAVTFEADAVLGSTTTPQALTSNGTVLMNLATPATFELGASHPNPLGAGAASLRYSVPRETHVSLELFDVNGRRVRQIVNGLQSPGWYDVTIESGGLRGGVYFYRMRAGSFSATRRMVVVR